MAKPLGSIGACASIALAHIPCCGLSLFAAIGGAGATSLGWLEALEPYRPLFLALGVAQLVWMFAHAARTKAGPCDHACNHNHANDRTLRFRNAYATLGVMALIWAGGLLFEAQHHASHNHVATASGEPCCPEHAPN